MFTGFHWFIIRLTKYDFNKINTIRIFTNIFTYLTWGAMIGFAFYSNFTELIVTMLLSYLSYGCHFAAVDLLGGGK